MLTDAMNDINSLIAEFGQKGGFVGKGCIDRRYIPASEKVVYFYDNFTPLTDTALEIGSGVIFFHSASELVNQQHGYRFDSDGRIIDGWDNRFVMAVFNDNPIVIDIEGQGDSILALYGGGDFFPIANTIDEFFAAFSISLKVQYKDFANEPLNDETLELKPEYIEKINRALRPVMKNDFIGEFMDFFFG